MGKQVEGPAAWRQGRVDPEVPRPGGCSKQAARHQRNESPARPIPLLLGGHRGWDSPLPTQEGDIGLGPRKPHPEVLRLSSPPGRGERVLETEMQFLGGRTRFPMNGAGGQSSTNHERKTYPSASASCREGRKWIACSRQDLKLVTPCWGGSLRNDDKSTIGKRKN